MALGSERHLGPDSLVGQRLGRYEILTHLASGGMASVYVARAVGAAGFERLVAVKVLHQHLAHDSDFISMFLDEARLAARIRHPNVVPTLELSDVASEGLFLVMEYVEGDHLGALLKSMAEKQVRMPPSVALRILMDAIEGLAAAHNLTGQDGKALEIVHRDISPHNILVGVDGVTRITDFGVAKAEVRLSSTRDGLLKGKLAYMAPEQASTGQADQRSDIFSMGVVAWETVTGRRLFRGESNGELLRRLLYDPVPRPSMYEPDLEALDAVMTKALARRPEARFQSAGEFLDALEQASGELGGVQSGRHVAKLATRHLGAKVELERNRIRAVIDDLGSGSNPLMPSPDLTPSSLRSLTPSNIRATYAADSALTLGARPTNRQLGAEISSPSQPNGAPAGAFVADASSAARSRSSVGLWLLIGAVGTILLLSVAAWALGLLRIGVGSEPTVSERPVTAPPTNGQAVGQLPVNGQTSTVQSAPEPQVVPAAPSADDPNPNTANPNTDPSGNPNEPRVSATAAPDPVGDLPTTVTTTVPTTVPTTLPEGPSRTSRAGHRERTAQAAAASDPSRNVQTSAGQPPTPQAPNRPMTPPAEEPATQQEPRNVAPSEPPAESPDILPNPYRHS